jgi:hypothetical protein
VQLLIERIRARIADDRPCDIPGEWLPVQNPAELDALLAVEAQLGFRLPALLRRLYTEVGNGGFGPVFGLLPLSVASLGEGRTPEVEFELAGDYARLVRRYAGNLEHSWPSALVPVFYCGCTVFEFVDCRDPDGPVVWFDEASEELAVLFNGERMPIPSLERRLELWLEGRKAW